MNRIYQGKVTAVEIPDARCVMFMRNGDAPDRVLTMMSGFRDATESARDLTSLQGIEGGAAALYFRRSFRSDASPGGG